MKLQESLGIPPRVDYMGLRRSEDVRFARFAGIEEPFWLNFPEAPLRGYASMDALFGSVRREDSEIQHQISQSLKRTVREEGVNEVYAPAANGGHVDHLVVLSAVFQALQGMNEIPKLYLYEELPYALKRIPSAWVAGTFWVRDPRRISEVLHAKTKGIACYRSQIYAQFGSPIQMRIKIGIHARRKGAEIGSRGAYELLWHVPDVE